MLAVFLALGPCLAKTATPADIEALRAQAARGSSDAATEVGIIYEYGTGVPVDIAQARLWFEKAAAAGYGPAMTQIGLMYYEGYGVAKDDEKARDWWKRALAAGDAKAGEYLGKLPQ